MIEIIDGKLKLNDRILEFVDPVRSFLRVGEKIVVFCNPNYIDKNQWRLSWEKNDHKNVYVLNSAGKTIWKFEKPATGIDDIISFWIKLSEEIDKDSHFWISTPNYAYLVNIEDLSVLKEINTYILK